MSRFVTKDGPLTFGVRTAGQFVESGPQLLTGAYDPSGGGGCDVPQGSLFLRTNGGDGTTIYGKHGSDPTDWAAL